MPSQCRQLPSVEGTNGNSFENCVCDFGKLRNPYTLSVVLLIVQEYQISRSFLKYIFHRIREDRMTLKRNGVNINRRRQLLRRSEPKRSCQEHMLKR